jgi:acyl-CoA synthetase (AMP-forming)/AMP-acid ligase II
MMERERCTLISGNDTLFQMLMGHADFPKRKLACAAAGRRPAADHARDHRPHGREAICAAYGLSEASPNVVMSDWRDPETCGAGLGLPHRRRRDQDFPERRDSGARLERHARLLNNPRPPPRPSPPTAGCAPATSAA